MKLVCAVCLYQRYEEREAEVITIVNGQAVCREHFAVIANNQLRNAGVLALRTIGHLYFDPMLH